MPRGHRLGRPGQGLERFALWSNSGVLDTALPLSGVGNTGWRFSGVRNTEIVQREVNRTQEPPIHAFQSFLVGVTMI